MTLRAMRDIYSDATDDIPHNLGRAAGCRLVLDTEQHQATVGRQEGLWHFTRPAE